MNSSEIQVSDSFAIVVLFGALIFVGKTIYDLIKSASLSHKEKTYLAFIICLLPIYGSFIFYFYLKSNYGAGKKLRY